MGDRLSLYAQADAFTEGEGDRWFERNRQALEDLEPSQDEILNLIAMHGIEPRNALEIGAANGYRLNALASRYGCAGSGVDISAAAITDGRSQFPNLRLVTGRAHALPFAEQFDVVIVNFVLHWVDRGLILRVVSEVDRVLSDGGFLLIGDFFPDRPVRRPYHHLPESGVYTYKQDYAAAFLASGCYETIERVVGMHSTATPPEKGGAANRTATWLLRKRLQGLYGDEEAAVPALEDGAGSRPAPTP